MALLFELYWAVVCG